MNVSYRWLRDIAPGYAGTVAELVERLALRGAPVEEVVDLAAGLQDVKVARVVEAGRHPNADRLSLCRVDAGGPELLSVVCGAPNVRAGAYYPFAPAGSTLPGGLTLKRAKIRGEVSEGMLCSEKELGLGTDHAGILEIPPAPLGTPFVEALGLDDARLDVEVTANRPDLLSHRGIARELVGEAGLVVPAIPGATPVHLALRTDPREVEVGGVCIRIEEPELCWRFLGAVVRGVKVGPSPVWMQRRLRAAGARPINNVVDATNYVMLELGQPLHAYDLSRVGGQTLVVRSARAGERLRTLDGQERELRPGMLMICDAHVPVGVAGIMGGEDSEVRDDTTDVLLEGALFEPAQVRRTRRALDLPTDASYRFERGVDPEGHEVAFRRAVELIVATAGGRTDAEGLDVCPRPWRPAAVQLRPARVKHVLGVDFSESEVASLLAPLGFVAAPAADGAPAFVVPGPRSYDVTREIDLIEEVARTYGYDRFPDQLGPYRPSAVPDHPLFELETRLRQHLSASGLYEVHTLAFADRGEVAIPNPLSAEGTHLRASLLPGVLRVLEYNFARSQRDVRLFEIGTVFRSAAAGERPVEETRLAAVLAGRRDRPHWSRPEVPFEFWDIKGLLDSVLDVVGGTSGGRPGPADLAGGALEGQWSVWRGDAPVAVAGPVAAGALDAPPWAGPVWGLEVVLPSGWRLHPVEPVRPLPTFPASERDLALLVPWETAAARVEELIRAEGGPLLAGIELFDVYEGTGLPAGRRSLAFRLRFQAADRTLRDQDVERATRRLLTALKETLDVDART